MLEILKALIYGVVEGITEWLPISSTGHLILVEEILKFNTSAEFLEMFRVIIQLGAIMAVVVLYFHKLNPFSPKKNRVQRNNTITLWIKVVIACIPAGVMGILLDDWLDEHLYNFIVVAIMLIVYGGLFIYIEKQNEGKKARITKLTELSYQTALLIGVFQVLSLIPGTSRSGVTILGALILGTSRFVAAEFTFYLGIPVMAGASLLKIVKLGFDYSAVEIIALLVGCITAFFVSIFAIKFLMGYIKKHDFKIFGYYRIVLGVVVFAFFLFNR
jgi:undecaprenyl-diphosphatase UppP